MARRLSISPRSRKLARTAFAVFPFVLLGGLAMMAVNSVIGFGSADFQATLHTRSFAAIAIGCATAVIARAILIRRNRLGWLLFGLGVACLAAGDLWWTTFLAQLEEQPFPSIADVFYLAAYPLLAAGLVFVLRGRMTRPPLSMWLDALLGVLAIMAIGTGLLLNTIEAGTAGGTSLQVAVAAAYPLADVALVALIGAVIALTGARLDRPLMLVMGATISISIADILFFTQSTVGSWEEGGLIDLLWPLGAALFAFAAWAPVPATRIVPASGMRALVVPAVFATAIIAAQIFVLHGVIPHALADAALLVLVVRLVVGANENRGLVDKLGMDGLTRLGNRGRLAADMSRAIAFGRTQTLVFADLDGFKLYNDAFGHPAGDAMLSRLSGALRDAVAGIGRAYRIGGDEFCVLLDGNADETEGGREAISAALSESGEGFAVGVSLGSVEIPLESSDAEAAIQIADQRMYESKDSRREETQHREAVTVLVEAQREREPELGEHVTGVARLAAKVGQRMGLLPGEVAILTRAAELHDIGKIAIPDAILNKPGKLTEEEWSFMRQHTVLGDRILSSAGTLAPYARIVRSSHERVDGGGYPDGLHGEQIPLASRIIFACDAYNAMTTERPYASARTQDEAIAELIGCSGSQFDSGVVDALCEVLFMERLASTAPATETATAAIPLIGGLMPTPASFPT